MRKVLVIQHVPHEGLGIIGPALDRSGFHVDFLKVYEDLDIPLTTDGYSALIVLGGPMGVYEEEQFPFIIKELRLIKSALKQRLPILGICLGAQLLAKAAGAEVYKGGAKEIGWYDVELTEEGEQDVLFRGLPARFKVFQWHGDTFNIPENGYNLASSPLFPNQLVKAGAKAYGIQFHLEVTEDMIRQWLEVNKDELKALKNINPEKIIEEIPSRINELHRLGGSIITKFLRLVD